MVLEVFFHDCEKAELDLNYLTSFIAAVVGLSIKPSFLWHTGCIV